MNIINRYISWLAREHGTERAKKRFKNGLVVVFIILGFIQYYTTKEGGELLFLKFMLFAIPIALLVGGAETYLVYKKLNKPDEAFNRVFLMSVFFMLLEAAMYIIYIIERNKLNEYKRVIEQLNKMVNG